MAILGFKLVDQLQNSLLLHYIEINCVFLDLGVYFYLYLGEGAFLIAQLVKCLQCRRTWFDSWVRKIHWRKDRLPTPVLLGFPCGSAGKESACNEGDLGSIPGLGRFPWRKERLPTSVFWPREIHGLYSPWGPKESDTTEQLSLTPFIYFNQNNAATQMEPILS